MSDKRDEDRDRVRLSQVLAGALAAVTAALVGSTMGVAGTIVGAGLASVVSTVGSALYLRSIQRTSETVRAKVVGRAGGTTVLVSDDPGAEVEADAAETAPPPGRRRLRWQVVVVGSVIAFALGMGVVTGIEWLRGESLSGGAGTTFGSVVDPHRDSGTQKSTPSSDPPATSTTTPPPTDSQSPPTTTTTEPPSSTSSSSGTQDPTTTTTEPPTTTTTEPPASDAG